MVGSELAREAGGAGFKVEGKSSQELDFTDRKAVFLELSSLKPEYLVIAAAKVGGIRANSNYPVDFLSSNLQIQTNLLDAAHKANVRRVLFLGSSCIYPKYATQPIIEESLLSGALEPSNSHYAIAKIAGVKLVEAYRKQHNRQWISVMPSNLYGPGDNFDSELAHVLPALIHKLHLANLEGAQSVQLWGDGTPMREFLHVSDLAKALVLLLMNYDENPPINVGSGEEVTIKTLAEMVARTVGYSGAINFGANSLNGTPRKILESSKIRNLGWQPSISLAKGLEHTYNWYLENLKER
jgi:GDP-L-fucose synthase